MKISQFAFFIVAGFITFSCNKQENNSAKSNINCPELDDLMIQMKETEKSLSESTSWNEIKPELDSFLNGVKFNYSSGDSDCLFTNTLYKPEVSRFEFAERLYSYLLKNKSLEGLEYFISTMEVFRKDKEIFEFFTEKLAMIAFKDPDLYYSYYKAHPEKQSALLKETRWKILDLKKTAASFRPLKNKEISDLLAKLSVK
jgi:hypothetical protein